jgi:phage terminase large subunit-like protein
MTKSNGSRSIAGSTFSATEGFSAQIRRAKRLPAEEPKVRNLLLNQRVSPGSRLISWAEWMACVGEADIEDGEVVYLGLDLSSTTDLTALIMVMAAHPARIRSFF